MKFYRFTLIELLVVIGIAAMLTAIAVPAYNKVLNSNHTDRAAAALKLALEQAQVRAISSRKNVALIIPNGTNNHFYDTANNDDFNEQSQNNYYLGSVRMAYVEKDGDNWQFVKWVPESNWLEPFNNAKIVSVTNQYGDLPEHEGDRLSRYVNSLYSTSLYDGDLNGGFIGISGLPGSPGNRCGIVFSPFGGLRGTRSDLYIAVAECKMTGDTTDPDLTFPGGNNTNNTEIYNYIILDINRINGKVSYHAYRE